VETSRRVDQVHYVSYQFNPIDFPFSNTQKNIYKGEIVYLRRNIIFNNLSENNNYFKMNYFKSDVLQ
jgi:hypothetical protein